MKRILISLATAAAVFVIGASALALPGPESDLSTLEITFTARDPALSNPVEKQRTYYARNQGWDFGDRSAYRCAWVEFYSNPTNHAAGTELFEVEFHAIADYEVQVPGGNIEITDSGGQEAPDATINAECWGADNAGTFAADASDHFPHGVEIVFYHDGNSDGRIDQIPADERARISYSEPTVPECGRLYWTDGDEPGEAWLWWDEDGAADRFMHGDGLCGGGPEEPISIVQAQPRNLAPGIAVCSETAEGSLCQGLSPQTADLSLSVSVVNDDNGTAVASDFTVAAAGPTPLSGAGSVQGDVDPGTYDLSVTGPAGYTFGAFDCADPLTLVGGQSATCSVTVDDNPRIVGLEAGKTVLQCPGGGTPAVISTNPLKASC